MHATPPVGLPDPEPLPFAGLKVLDCASFIAAPAAATVLADFGADVVKIEPPGGDPHRGLWQLPGAPPADINYPWDLDSRHKRSLVLDLKHAEGQALLHQLVATADVFITNLPLRVRQRLAIDADTLLALNPRLIYASLTGYGETGPEADKSAFDVTAYWARSGLMDLVRADHQAPPVKPVGGMGDHPSAITLFAAITTALYRRERTGRGGQVGTSLMANGLWSNGLQVQAQLSGVRYAPRQPRTHVPHALGNMYRCADGRWLNLLVLNETRQWHALVGALGRPGLEDDARFATPAARAAHHVEFIALLDACFAEHNLATWRSRLDAAGITFGVIGTLADIDDDPQMHASGALLPFSHRPGLSLANPIRLQGMPQRRPGPAPALGQHSVALLREAGLSDSAITGLIAAGVVGAEAGSHPHDTPSA